MVYDGDCEFCRRWITRWKRLTGVHVDYESFQNISINYPEIPLERFQKAVQLIDIDGTVYSGAEAVFRAFRRTPSRVWLWRLYQYIPGMRFVCECVYYSVSRLR
ncbi:MAG: DUF393 domain-containing protein [candidate division Zixibacteria bacterium]|nr:DUF393 domain-containing protein [candidate division Zixibacteria bacterium]